MFKYPGEMGTTGSVRVIGEVDRVRREATLARSVTANCKLQTATPTIFSDFQQREEYQYDALRLNFHTLDT